MYLYVKKFTIGFICTLSLMLINIATAYCIDFETVLNKALDTSTDIQLTEIDKEIAMYSKKESTSVFYPKLYARYSSYYNYDFASRGANRTSIHGKLYPDSSQWSSAGVLGLEYEIFKFGVDYKTYKWSLKNYDIANIQIRQTKKNIALSIVDIYEQVLINYTLMISYEELARNASELYEVYKRLNSAGLIAKQYQYMAGTQVAEFVSKKLNSEKSLLEALQSLEYHTFEKYDLKIINPQSFILTDVNTLPEPTKYPEYEILKTKIEQKELEIGIHNRSQFPVVSLFADYNITGTSRMKYNKATNDMMKDNYRVGFNVSVNLFEGFEYNHKRARLRAEKSRLGIEMVQLLQSIKINNEQLIATRNYLDRIKEQNDLATSHTEEVFSMSESLRKVQLTGADELLKQRIDTLEKLQDQQVITIQFAAKAKRLDITNRFVQEY